MTKKQAVSSPGELMRLFWLTKHEMRRCVSNALKGLGLSSAQYMALSTLEREGELTNSELARLCSITPQSMIRIMQGLVDLKLVESQEDPMHGRKIQFRLSKQTGPLLTKAKRSIDAVETNMLSKMSKNEARTFINLLESCLVVVREM